MVILSACDGGDNLFKALRQTPGSGPSFES